MQFLVGTLHALSASLRATLKEQNITLIVTKGGLDAGHSGSSTTR